MLPVPSGVERGQRDNMCRRSCLVEISILIVARYSFEARSNQALTDTCTELGTLLGRIQDVHVPTLVHPLSAGGKLPRSHRLSFHGTAHSPFARPGIPRVVGAPGDRMPMRRSLSFVPGQFETPLDWVLRKSRTYR